MNLREEDTQVGQVSGGSYGCEVGPLGPQQDMWAFDPIAGTFPPMERDTSPSAFTGGTGGGGLGGQAEPPYPGDDRYERRGF